MLNCQAVIDMKEKILLFLILFLSVVSAFSQYDECGIPQIRNFSPADYRQESQNFCVVQDQNSLMYFGNTNGIMEYDGEHWSIVKVPGRSKLAVGSDNTIYYGCYNSVGKVQYYNGRIGVEEFANNLDCTLGQIVNVVVGGDAVYFASGDKLFMYADSTLRKVIDGELFKLFRLGSAVYVQRKISPLKRLNHGKFEDDVFCQAVDSIEVADMVRTADGIVVLRDEQRSCFFM